MKAEEIINGMRELHGDAWLPAFKALVFTTTVRRAFKLHLGPGPARAKVVALQPEGALSARVAQAMLEYEARTHCVGVAGACPVCLDDLLRVMADARRIAGLPWLH